MTTLLWIVAGLAGVFAAWWVIKIVTSMVVPVSVSGQAFLKQQIKKQGIDPDSVPSECIKDFVSFAQKVSAIRAKPGSTAYRAEVVRVLDMVAFLFVLWRENPESEEFEQYGDTGNPYREIFERHGFR